MRCDTLCLPHTKTERAFFASFDLILCVTQYSESESTGFYQPAGTKLLLSATMSTFEDELVARLDNDIQEFCLHMISSRPVVYCFVFRFMTVN